MERTISLIIDDPMPHHYFYCVQYTDRTTAQGAPIVKTVLMQTLQKESG